VSGIHWAAKTGVLLVGSRAMMGQLRCADGIVVGVVAVEVGGGMVSQGLGAWGGCLGGSGVEGECSVVVGCIVIVIVVGSDVLVFVGSVIIVGGSGGTIRSASGSGNWPVSMFQRGRHLRASGIQRISLVSVLLFIICSMTSVQWAQAIHRQLSFGSHPASVPVSQVAPG